MKRVVALIDMDCFYCACERALDESLVGKPMAVIQYNPFQGDGSASATGVISLPAEPASARVAVMPATSMSAARSLVQRAPCVPRRVSRSRESSYLPWSTSMQRVAVATHLPIVTCPLR